MPDDLQRARADRLEADNARLLEQLDEATARAAGRERRLAGLVTRLTETARAADENERRAVWQAHRTDYVGWQLESLRGSRWSRLGAVLVGARTPKGLLALPKGLAGVLRGRLRTAAPERPEQARAPKIGPADTEVVEIPSPVVPDGPVNRPELTVAVIATPATARSLRYEWRQLDGFGPGDWRETLTADRPALLLVESAARWADLRELVGWCREQGIPTALWDTGGDTESASLFDWVFTVDPGSVAAYREVLGHDRVRVLGFAAQPRLHNPVRVPGHGRYDLAYQHADGPAELETVIRPALELGVHVHNGTALPAEYGPHLAGSPSPESLTAAAKLYKVVLNADPAHVCPRRLYELSAAAVPVLSGPGRAVTEVFGDLIPAVATGAEAASLLRTLLRSPELRDRQAHLAMRTVLAGHTYRHRAHTLLSEVGIADPLPVPAVSVIMPTNRPEQLAHAFAQVAVQTHRPLQFIVILHGLDEDGVRERALAAGIEDVVVIEAGKELSLGACLNLGIEAADGDLIAKMDDDELYGPHYLADLVAAFGFTEAEVTGKLAHYVHLRGMGATILRMPEHEHRYVNAVRGGAFLARGDLLREYRFEDLSQGEDTDLFRRLHGDGVKIYSADRYSFVTIRQADPGWHTWQISDRDLLHQARIEFYGQPGEHVLI